MAEEKSEKSGEKENKNNVFNAIELAMQLGYLIALPLIFFAVAGRFLDKYFGTSPWLFIAGILFSIFVSSFLVYSKTVKIISGAGDRQKEISRVTPQTIDKNQEIKKQPLNH